MTFTSPLALISAITASSLTVALLVGFAVAPQPPAPAPPAAGPPTPAAPENAIRHVHDPCIIRDGAYFYVFSTGPGVMVRRSRDLIHWEFVGQVFKEPVPEWAAREIPGSSALWAPDIHFYNGRYRLYYSVSTFGSNRSAIGMTSTRSLDPASPHYGWTDEGKVWESFRTSNYNAIDPNIVLRPSGEPVLSFGSFWSGLKMVSLNPHTGKPALNTPLLSIAERPSPDALEAPFIVRRNGWYYLLVSFDFCCRGTRSTYNVRMGRSKNVEGPYVDREGVALLKGGGTPLLATDGDVIGPGHCAVLRDRNRDYLVHHYYDGRENGIPTLQVRPLRWDRDGWPIAEAPLIAPGK